MAAEGLSDFGTEGFAKRVDCILVGPQLFVFLVRNFNVNDLDIVQGHVIHDSFIGCKQDARNAHADAQHLHVGWDLIWISMYFSRHKWELGCRGLHQRQLPIVG